MRILSAVIIGLLVLSSCRRDPEIVLPNTPNDTTTHLPDTSTITGYNILQKLPGIWHGPVTSATPLGSYQEWVVDFRPISASQVSAKNELDSLNDIFMSFFIAQHDSAYMIFFRNGGGFAGNVRNAYMKIDSVYESSSLCFYRFVDPVSGGKRVDTDITFKDDSMIMHVHTNVYNTLSEPVTHMIWRAQLKDTTSAQQAIAQFNYPQKTVVKNFNTTFESVTEAVFYSESDDPYPEEDQPYLGQSHITINIANPPTIDAAKKVLIIITTQPLFDGVSFQAQNLIYRSRYVFVGAADPTGYTFNYMHPGSYFINAIYDSNGDFNFSTGDYMNGSFDVPITLAPYGAVNQAVTINLLIP